MIPTPKSIFLCPFLLVYLFFSSELYPSEKHKIIKQNHYCSNDTTRYRWNFNKYLTDPRVPKLAKDIFMGKHWTLNDFNGSLSLLDSLTAKDFSSRPFYFKVVTKSFKKADGFYTEGLGGACKTYVEENTIEFINYFIGKESFTKKELKDWSGIVMLEINLVAENEDKEVLNKLISTLNRNCQSCSLNQRQILSYFIAQLKLQWNENQRNTPK